LHQPTQLNKEILLISHNFSPEPTGIGKYNGEMINWLAENGYNCTVITTFPYYPHWKVQAPYKNRWYKKEIISYPNTKCTVSIFRCPAYIPANPTGKKRVIQDVSFWTFMFWKVLRMAFSKKKFDLIITIAPPFHLAYLGLLFKNKKGGKLLYHIQDLQIEAAQKLKLISTEKIFDTVYKIEKNILEKADFVSSISEGMINKVKAKVNKEVLFFPNWVDTKNFFPMESHKVLKGKWGYKSDDVIYMYSGAIGVKQGLEGLLCAAEILLERENFKFIICGSGPYMKKLMEFAANKHLTNVKFLPVQDVDVFNEFLNMADYHLILQKANAGDLVMPSKLATILAVGGVCLVTTIKGTSLYNLVSQFNLGYITEPDNYKLLAEVICGLDSDSSFNEKRKNARNYAVQHLDINSVMNGFLNKIFV
jgi:colanic acid biosynthesis glycosyl transferase WcaI